MVIITDLELTEEHEFVCSAQIIISPLTNPDSADKEPVWYLVSYAACDLSTHA